MSAPPASSDSSIITLPRTVEPREHHLFDYFRTIASERPHEFGSLTVERSSRKGRYLTTQRTREIGEIIFTEKPLLAVSDDMNVCLGCGVRHVTPSTCSTFTQSILPMKSTLTAAESIAHQTGYTISRVRGVMKWIGICFASIFAPQRDRTKRGLTEEQRKAACQQWILLGLDDGSVTRETTQGVVTTPRAADPDRTLLTDLIHAALPLTWKKSITKEIVENCINVLDLNSHETSEVVPPASSSSPPSADVLPGVDGTPGDAVFPFFAMIEHSCQENCAWTISEGNMQISAMRPIQVCREMDFNFQTAIVRGLSPSFEKCLAMNPVPIDVQLAEKQHAAYIDALRTLLPAGPSSIIDIPGHADYADCNFIEDTALILGSSLVLTRPGAPSRRGEVDAVGEVLMKKYGSVWRRTLEITEPATLDGGDVLYTGRHVFVGISSRTNQAAVDQLTRAFGGPASSDPAARSPFTVHALPVEAGLHLKSILSILDSHTLVIDASPAATAIKDAIVRIDSSYRFIRTPDAPPSNVLRVGQTVLIQKGFPESERILTHACKARGLTVLPLDMSELIKADGALTCGSLLATIRLDESNHTHATDDELVSESATLSINYAPSYLPTSKRREYLTSSYGFACVCPLCMGIVPDRARSFRCAEVGCASGLVAPLGDAASADDTAAWSACTVCDKSPSARAIQAYLDSEQAAIAALKRRAVAAAIPAAQVLDQLVEDSDLLRSIRPDVEAVVEAVLNGSGGGGLDATAAGAADNAASPAVASSGAQTKSSFSVTPSLSKTARKHALQRRKAAANKVGFGASTSASLPPSSVASPLSSAMRASIQLLAPSHYLIHQLVEMLLCIAIHEAQHADTSSRAQALWSRVHTYSKLRIANIQRVCGVHHWSLAREHDRLASILVMAGQPTQAIEYWQAAYQVHTTLFGEEADSTRRAKARVQAPPQTPEQL